MRTPLLPVVNRSEQRRRRGARTFLYRSLRIAIRQLIQGINLLGALHRLSALATKYVWLETTLRGLPAAFLSCMNLQGSLSARQGERSNVKIRTCRYCGSLWPYEHLLQVKRSPSAGLMRVSFVPSGKTTTQRFWCTVRWWNWTDLTFSPHLRQRWMALELRKQHVSDVEAQIEGKM